MFTFAGLVLVLIAAKNDAAITPLNDTKTSAVGDDETIPWDYDNADDVDIVDWSFKSPSSPTPETIMSKPGADNANVFNDFNVEHVSDGIITLKEVTLDNAGIYYCSVAYTLASGLAPVTGTVTLSVITAPTPGYAAGTSNNEQEQHQPPPPAGANHSRLPNKHSQWQDNKDDDHPLAGVDIPTQTAGALPIDTPRKDKKKTNKKKKDKQEDNQKTETVLDF